MSDSGTFEPLVVQVSDSGTFEPLVVLFQTLKADMG